MPPTPLAKGVQGRGTSSQSLCSDSHSVFRVAREVVNQARPGQNDAISMMAEKIASLQQGGSISVYYYFYCCDLKRMLEPFLLLMKGDEFGLLF